MKFVKEFVIAANVSLPSVIALNLNVVVDVEKCVSVVAKEKFFVLAFEFMNLFISSQLRLNFH